MFETTIFSIRHFLHSASSLPYTKTKKEESQAKTNIFQIVLYLDE